MAPLIFECPRTSRAIDAGIQTESRTIAAASCVKLTVFCPHCRSPHEFPIKYGRLSEARMPEILIDPERAIAVIA